MSTKSNDNNYLLIQRQLEQIVTMNTNLNDKVSSLEKKCLRKDAEELNECSGDEHETSKPSLSSINFQITLIKYEDFQDYVAQVSAANWIINRDTLFPQNDNIRYVFLNIISYKIKFNFLTYLGEFYNQM